MIAAFGRWRAAALAALCTFLAGVAGHAFEPISQREACAFTRELPPRFPCDRPGRADRGGIRACLRQAAGFSWVQVARLIAQCRGTGGLRDRRGAAKPFACKHSDADVRLPADADRRAWRHPDFFEHQALLMAEA